MNIAFLKKDKNVADLAARLYKTTPENRKAVETALLEANPHLTSGRLPETAVLVVPDVPGVKVTETSTPSEPVLGELLQSIKSALKVAEARLTEGVERTASEFRETTELLKQKEVKDLAKRHAELKDPLAAAAAEAKEQDKNLAKLKTAQKKAIDQLEDDLKEFAKALRI